MGRRCLFSWCTNSKPLYGFPRDADRARLWLWAVGWPLTTDTSKLFVCGNHFSRESFENWRQVEFGFTREEKLRLGKNAVPLYIFTNAVNAGFCKNLLIKDGAVPTLGPTSNPQPIAKDLPLLASGQSSLTKEPSTQTTVRIQAKPESDRRLAKTIIDIGSAFALWQKFRDENGFKTDTELAFYLLRRTACCADLSARCKKRKLDPLTDVASEDCESESSQHRNGHHQVPSPSQTVEPAQTEIKSKDQLGSEDQLRLENQIKQEDQMRLEDRINSEDQLSSENQSSVAPALNNEDIVPESSTSTIKNEIKEEPVETEVQPENRLQISMDSVTTSDKITPSFVQTVNSVSMEVKEEHTEGPLVPNKTHFTGLFGTCFQCGEPMQEYTTRSSGSLNQLQWKCSNGHLMCLFSNNNPTRTHTHLS